MDESYDDGADERKESSFSGNSASDNFSQQGGSSNDKANSTGSDKNAETDNYDIENIQSLTEQMNEAFDEEEKNFIESNSSAAKVNVGAIFAVIFIIIALVVLAIMILTRLSESDKKAESNMLNSGGKKIPNVEAMLGGNNSSADYVPGSINESPDGTKNEEYDASDLSDEDIDEILNGLPDEYKLPGKSTSAPVNPVNIVKQAEPGTAPFREEKKTPETQQETPAPDPIRPQPQQSPAPAPSKSETTNPVQNIVAAVSENKDEPFKKPDTRYSNSVRKIEGLAGFPQNNGSSSSNPLLDLAYPDPSQMSRDDYIRQVAALQEAQGSTAGASSAMSQNDSVEASKNEFFNDSGTDAGSGTYLPRNTIWDGTIIKGALETGINTDNPGVVIARVTENVYSSYDFSKLLIPEGTLLYATYNSSVAYGQDRVQIAWNLLIRPDGYRMELGNMNGVDSKGYSGVAGWKYNHIWEELKALGLVAMYSILNTEITKDIEKQKNEFISNAMTDVYGATQRVANGMVERALDIKPSITIDPGTEIKLITNQPLTLPPIEPYPVTQKYVRY